MKDMIAFFVFITSLVILGFIMRFGIHTKTMFCLSILAFAGLIFSKTLSAEEDE